MHVLSSLVSMSLKLYKVHEHASCLFKSVQVVLSCLDFINVFKHIVDLLFESVLCAKHSFSSRHGPIYIIILKIVLKEGFYLLESFLS